MNLYLVYVSNSDEQEEHQVMFMFDEKIKAMEFVDLCLEQDLQARIRIDKEKEGE